MDLTTPASRFMFEGMEIALKASCAVFGNIKREHPTLNEELIVLRAIRDANVPKFLQEDLKLFNGIVSDLFPKIKED